MPAQAYRNPLVVSDVPVSEGTERVSCKRKCMVKVATGEMFRRHFSITVQWRFGGIVAPNSGSLGLTLGPCSTSSFNVVSVLLSRFG